MHICVSKLAIVGRRQALIWPNAGKFIIDPLGTKFSEILIEIHTFSFKKMNLKMSSGKWRPFCLGLNVLISLWFNYSSTTWFVSRWFLFYGYVLLSQPAAIHSTWRNMIEIIFYIVKQRHYKKHQNRYTHAVSGVLKEQAVNCCHGVLVIAGRSGVLGCLMWHKGCTAFIEILLKVIIWQYLCVICFNLVYLIAILRIWDLL